MWLVGFGKRFNSQSGLVTGPNGRSSLFGAANGARSHQEKPRRVRSPADGKPEAGGNGHLERCEKLRRLRTAEWKASTVQKRRRLRTRKRTAATAREAETSSDDSADGIGGVGSREVFGRPGGRHRRLMDRSLRRSVRETIPRTPEGPTISPRLRSLCGKQELDGKGQEGRRCRKRRSRDEEG
jgi:hypothetical protein